jgi:predicted O-methyltransferase YrrM
LLSRKHWTEVDRYLEDLVIVSDPALDNTIKSMVDAGLPPIQVSPALGKLLMIMARSMGAKNILEVGTLAGYSAIWLARGLASGGKLISLESEQHHAEIAWDNICRAGLRDRVEIVVGNALDTMPELAAENRGPFDLIFIDADKPNNPDYYLLALKLSRPGTLIIVDNVVREGKIIDLRSADRAIKGVRRLNQLIATNPAVTGTVMQTVGAKGHDGFSVILVRGEQ